MPRDNSPKERQRIQLERKLGRRASYERILIVTEGSKTEPNYFGEIRSAFKLHSANVAVRPSELGTTPIQVVQYAKQLFEKGDRYRNIQPRAFERIFAVFDRDDHHSYDEAIRLAESFDGKLKNDSRQTVQFSAITSIPSFELWLLLHFEDVKAPVHRSQVMQKLKLHLPDYEKGSIHTFASTRKHLDAAIQRAEALASKHTADSAPKPFTAIVELVKRLITLRA